MARREKSGSMDNLNLRKTATKKYKEMLKKGISNQCAIFSQLLLVKTSLESELLHLVQLIPASEETFIQYLYYHETSP